MTMTKQTKFILAIAIQLAIIFLIIIFKVAILTGGTDILLRIAPIDPRDPLRGDYASFQYEISNLDYYLAQGQSLKNGGTIYVLLRQSGKYWVTQSIQKTKPTSGEIFLKGKIASGAAENQDIFGYRNFGSSRLHIVYGIEEYFIPEGKGSGLNFWNRNQEAYTRVAVDENGNAVLKQLYIDDKPWP